MEFVQGVTGKCRHVKATATEPLLAKHWDERMNNNRKYRFSSSKFRPVLAAGIWSVRCVEASRPAKCVMRENGKGEKGRNSKGPVDSLRLLVFHFLLLPLFPITLPLQTTRKLNSGLQTSNLELLRLLLTATFILLCLPHIAWPDENE